MLFCVWRFRGFDFLSGFGIMGMGATLKFYQVMRTRKLGDTTFPCSTGRSYLGNLMKVLGHRTNARAVFGDSEYRTSQRTVG